MAKDKKESVKKTTKKVEKEAPKVIRGSYTQRGK
tara:strand:- start:334 stop:435 length:102 start_codon:yes stop_codon:yes gene_type:complete